MFSARLSRRDFHIEIVCRCLGPVKARGLLDGRSHERVR
jgi:hypothetical protein